MDMNGVLLNDSGKTKFLKHYEEKLMTTIKHRSLGTNVSYRGLIRLECYKLIKHLLGMEIYKPFVICGKNTQQKENLMYVIIVYDVQVERIDDLRKYLRRYLNWVQNSVFEGELTLAQLEEIKVGISRHTDKEKDHLLIYQVRDKDLLKKHTIGTLKSEPSTII
jgi:CRISPR-associated protein Cas2